MIDFIVYRLKAAGWILSHRFEKDRGYVLQWAPGGRQRALLLQELIARHQLTAGSRARKFSVMRQEVGHASWGQPVSAVELDFWRACLEELEIGVEENALATLARVIASWQSC